MKNTIALISLLLISFSICIGHDNNESHYTYMKNPQSLINPQKYFEYQIVQNDHLWYLAKHFYNDNGQWRKLYIANPYIVDPNWIFPENWLIIPEIFADENGKPIIDTQSFSYKSAEDIVADSESESNKLLINESAISEEIDDAQTPPELELELDEANLSNLDEIEAANIDETNLDIENRETIEISSNYYDNYNKDSNLDDKIQLTDKSYSIKKIKKVRNTDYYNDPNWIIGLHGGYPFGDVPNEEDNLNYGLLIGTPLRATAGPLSVRLGGGILGFDYTDKIYPSAGLLLNLTINELLKFNTLVQLQVHGIGFYIPEGGIGTGAFGSVSIPLGDSPFNFGIYIGVGANNNSDTDNNNWKNAGLVLQLQL